MHGKRVNRGAYRRAAVKVLPPHRLGGAHKRGAPYSSRRALLSEAQASRCAPPQRKGTRLGVSGVGGCKTNPLGATPTREIRVCSEPRAEDSQDAGTTLKRNVPIWLAAVTFSPK